MIGIIPGYRTVNQKHRSMLNPSGERYIGLPVLNELNLNNGCNYNGPKEGKSVMNNVRAAELDYHVRATSTRISLK